MPCFCLSLLNSWDNGCASLCLAFLIFSVCLLGLAKPPNLISVTRLTYHVLLNKADDYCLALSENNAFYFYMILLEMSLFYWAQICLLVAFTICWSFLETGVEAQIFNSYFNSTSSDICSYYSFSSDLLFLVPAIVQMWKMDSGPGPPSLYPSSS